MVTPWKLVVYHYHFFLTINEKTQCIASSRVCIFSDKKALNAFRKLSQWWYWREKVTISTLSLLDIWWGYSRKDLEVSIAIYLARSFPYIAVPFLYVLRLSSHRSIENSIFVCLKIWVFPQLTITNYLFIVDIHEPTGIKRKLFNWSLHIHMNLLVRT